MGMMMRRHYKPAEVPPVEVVPVSPYDALTDDELFEAYVTNVDGEADTREGMAAELEALASE